MAETSSSASRHAEEHTKLVERLRRSLVTVVDDNNDLKEYNATLKKSQAQLLERTAELNDLVARLQASTAEAAAQNARLTRELATAKAALELTTAKASEFASELNAYRETEGAIATALATASVEDLPEAAACAAAATAGTAAGTESSADGTPAWLEAEARAGGEARSRSLKVQVLALRRALFKVARRAVKRGASEEQVGGDIDEAVGSVPSPPSQTPATAATSADTAGVDASGAAGDAVAPAPTTSLDRYRRALGVTSAPVLRADAAAALGQAGVDGGIAGQSGMPASADSEVVEPPAPIDHAVRGEAAVGSFSPSGAAAGGGGAEHVEPTEAGGEVTVGLLGFLLAPPIAIADALAAASEAVFGTDEEEDSKAGSDAGPVAVRTPL